MADPVYTLDDDYLDKIMRGAQAAPEVAIDDLSVEQASRLAKAIIDSKNVEILTVRVKEKGYAGLEKLLDELRGLSKPIFLDLNNVVISLNHLQKITQLLKSNLLSGLDISYCKCDLQSISELIKSVTMASTLASLNLSGCQIGDNGAVLLARQLQDHPSLSRINLYSNGITDRGIHELAKSFLSIKNLTYIRIGNNALTTKGIADLCDELMKKDSVIEYLHLAYMKLPDEACAHLCKLIELNKVRKLDIEGNWFSATSLRRFAHAVELSNVIIKLDLEANKFFSGYKGLSLPNLEQYPAQKKCFDQISLRLKQNNKL